MTDLIWPVLIMAGFYIAYFFWIASLHKFKGFCWRELVKNSILLFIGLALCGWAFRFIYEFYFTTRVYRPNSFDVVYDWGLMLGMGVYLVGFGIYELYQYLKEEK